ncbi:hypothetical protein M514_02660 [Trichuris suis]|uniref:Matrin-type domain-containing protein n=1 Tax=Trichuris suis TaxID=68888 RepID=A0A085MH60_9BILA|nr:hypothetical protein M513_02660 [Trichuris suis]KFD71085.1 hypothetical protein M514_02660 [Trichuris suis]
MNESIIEQQRRLHEERERLLDAMVREQVFVKNSFKARINSEHRIKRLLKRFTEITKNLLAIYADLDCSRRRELSSLSGPNEFAEFYTRLKHLREVHRDHPNEIAIPLSIEFQEMNRVINDVAKMEADMIEFTDEEGYGRFLDLHECYDKYLNLKGMQRIDYVTYVNTFDQVNEIPKQFKTAEYKAYIECIVRYLTNVLARVKPLLDLSDGLNEVQRNFENQWESDTFPGWPKASASAMLHKGAFLDLTPFNSAEELMNVGLDRLKSALRALGMKCGGTAEERAKRLFLTKGRKLSELDPSLFVKVKANAVELEKKERERNKEIASLEAQLFYLAEQVHDLRVATIENVERKQARIYGEFEEDEETGVPEAEEEDDDADDIPYNPKNLPLGWDGKPIPYWLYKLHGLNLNFPCEICGNQVYKGPKAFQKHFSEWRHAHGMRCLGIPNTAHFANITRMSDALELWNALREQKERERFKPDVDEEFEDSQGNVVNRKTYDDLRRQGLLLTFVLCYVWMLMTP